MSEAKWKFAAHQEYGKTVMDCNESMAIWWAMGTGKTALTLWWVRDAIRDGRISRALVVCPASLVESWKQGIRDMSKFEGFDEDDVELLKERVVITSYQKTYRTTKTTVHHRNGTESVRKTRSLRPEVDRPWGAVIVDEAHCIGAHSSRQTQAAITLSKLAKYTYVLTATPTHGGGGNADFSKLYGQLQFLTHGALWQGWTDFKQKAVVSVDPWGNPYRYNTSYCRSLMANYGIVCRLEDCFDMPGQRDVVMPCPLAETKMYRDLKEGNFEPYGIDITVAGGQYIKMLQICSGSMKRETDTMDLETSKMETLKDILEGTDEQVIIFCNFRASIDKCEKLCKAIGKRVGVFDGRSKGDTWKLLGEGKVDVLICQYQSGSVGLNLQSAHIMVQFEPCLSALLLEQARGRIYRKGQDKKCIYYILDTPHTLEHKVWDTVRNGMDVSNELLAKLAEGDGED